MINTYATSMIREREYAVVSSAPQDALMKKAAGAVADATAQILVDNDINVDKSRIIALVGGGDNGGDALYAASYLQDIGAMCTAIILSDTPHERGAARAEKSGVEMFAPDLSAKPEKIARKVRKIVAEADALIDGMLGTGGKGALREPMASCVKEINAYFADKEPPLTVAIDLPSGLGTDDGVVAGEHLVADRTVTMGARKPASLIPPACYSFGDSIDVVDLGLDLDSPVAIELEARDVGQLYQVPDVHDHKYTRGVVQVVAGSHTYPMTGVMCVEGAARAGAGMVRFRGPEETLLAVLSRMPETVMAEGRYQAQLIGPGVDPHDKNRAQQALEAARQCLAAKLPLVLDAGGVQLFTMIFPKHKVPDDRIVVMTPHAGEAAQILSQLGEGHDRGGISRSEVEEAPYNWAHRLAEITGTVVVLKGARTIIASSIVSDKTIRSQTFVDGGAPAWAGTAGSGDVLAGIVTTMVASHQAKAEQTGRTLKRGDVPAICAAGVWIHSRAAAVASDYGDKGPGHPIVATDIATAIPRAIGDALQAE